MFNRGLCDYQKTILGFEFYNGQKSVTTESPDAGLRYKYYGTVER
jgi:hypothetical protein